MTHKVPTVPHTPAITIVAYIYIIYSTYAIRTVPRHGYYAGASTCDGIAVTAYDSIQADYVLDNVCLVQTRVSLSPLVPCTGIGNRIDLIKRVQQETSRACCGSITDSEKLKRRSCERISYKTSRESCGVESLEYSANAFKFLPEPLVFRRRKPELKAKKKKCKFKKNMKNIQIYEFSLFSHI